MSIGIFIRSLATWSQEVLKRVDYICEICGGSAEHAHHIEPKKLQPFLALDPDNGLAVCKNVIMKKDIIKSVLQGK